MKSKNRYTVFEHEALYVHRGDNKLSSVQLKALQLFYKEKDFPYYSLVHNGIRFCEYVGVIKVGNLTIEVLPKADKTNDDTHWRSILVDMMRSVGLLNPDAPSYSDLKVKNTTVLDMYLDLFIVEVEKLIHQGLIRKYQKTESNNSALKGKLLIGKQVTTNAIHQDRFYIQHAIYDQQHLLHQILYKALMTISKSNVTSHLISRYEKTLLAFPEQKDIKISESLFDRICYDRKSQAYQTAIDIAKIILLNYHPDLNQGNNHVLALMFDMNKLWEKFIYRSLLKFASTEFKVHGQNQKYFWRSENGRSKKIVPDVILENINGTTIVLDTKWKIIDGSLPSDDDLRQMYTYSKHHNNAQVFLVYPGHDNLKAGGMFYHESGHEDMDGNRCGVISLKIENGKIEGQKILTSYIQNLL